MLKWYGAQDAFAAMPQRLFWGLTEPDIRRYVREGLDFLYVDNPYFNRGSRTRSFRLIRRNLHLTTMLDRPSNRRKKKYFLHLEPWRKNGKDIVIIPPSVWYERIFDCGDWLERTVKTLKMTTGRQIRVKHDKTIPLEGFLEKSWAVVTYGSVAGVEAAMLGIPVFSGPICPTLPISAGTLEQIDSPDYSDAREQWLNGLTHATWDLDEFHLINKDDYNYP